MASLTPWRAVAWLLCSSLASPCLCCMSFCLSVCRLIDSVLDPSLSMSRDPRLQFASKCGNAMDAQDWRYC
ncbi:hypothetical protein LY76DRAFT_593692 [Colletotrichum caudatum]|nr:hypothetical protein LY76DRAFT_593692 [Colletotrichum caudatum]